MKFIGIIPARYGSTRFPGKPLVMINGKTMIQRVYEQAKQALDEVWVATDDERILDHVLSFGGQALMTSKTCRNGTERCAEAASYLFLKANTVVINIQGDQPYVDPSIIQAVMQCYKIGNPDIVTVTCPLKHKDRDDPNCVKAYVTEAGWAKNFTRKVIYHPGLLVFKHIGIYAYPARVLLNLVKLKETDREQGANLEQLRWLQKYKILASYTTKDVTSIDIPEDLKKCGLTISGDISEIPKSLQYISMQSFHNVLRIFDEESAAIKRIPVNDHYEKAISLIYDNVHRLGGKLVTSGMGKAGGVAKDLATTFSSTGTPAVFLHPAEAQHGDLGVVQKNDVLLLISNSGETRELLELVHLVNDLWPYAKVISIIGTPGSKLEHFSDIVIHTGQSKEVCPLGLAPTTSTTVMGVIGDALVVLMMKRIGFTKEEYAKRHHGGYIGKKLNGNT